MSILTSKQVGVKSVLPAAPENLVYVNEELSGQEYTTTGCFDPSENSRRRHALRAVGCMVLDFDLVGYYAHLNDLSCSPAEAKRLMYEAYADDTKLSSLKARHADDAMTILSDVVGAFNGCVPTYVVDSGWGLHVYFWLNEFATEDKIDDVRSLNAQLVQAVNAAAGYEFADKGVHDTGTRLLRVVGSKNSKADGTPKSVEIVWELCDESARWSLQSVEPAATSPAPGTQGAGAEEERDFNSKKRSMLGWILRNKSIKKAYDEAESAQDSESDMALACSLARTNIPPVVIKVVLNEVGRASLPTRHANVEDYLNRTSINAWTTVQGPIAAMRASDDTGYVAAHPDALIEFTPDMTMFVAVNRVGQFDPRINKMLWVDERTKSIEWASDKCGEQLIADFYAFMKKDPPVVKNRRREFSDDSARDICVWLESTYGVNCTSKWGEAVQFLSSGLTKYNPVRDMLESCADKAREADLPDDILETWLIRIFGLEDTPLIRAYSKKWLIGGAARAVDPGVFIKSTLVLVGDQSAGKSSLLRILGGQFYDSPQVSDLSSKDSVMVCHYSWLLELEEMDFMKKNTIESIKKYLTTQSDKIRLPYSRSIETFYRPCFYAGTANRKDIMADSTGNDRFWCVEIPTGNTCDFDYARKVRDALLGKAYLAWMAVRDLDAEVVDSTVNLTLDELKLLRASNKDFSRTDELSDAVLPAAWEVAIGREFQEGEKRLYYVKLTELNELMFPEDHDQGRNKIVLDRSLQSRVEDALRSAGWKHGRQWQDRSLGKWGPTAYYAPADQIEAKVATHAPASRPNRFNRTLRANLRVV